MHRCRRCGPRPTRSPRARPSESRKRRSNGCAAAANDDPTRTEEIMKKKWLWIGLVAVVLIGMIGLNLARQSQGKVTGVQVAKVRVEDITSRVRAPGKIEPRTQVKISAD